MSTIPVCVRFSPMDESPKIIGRFEHDNTNLLYKEEGVGKTTLKFALLTLSSPLITLARLIRSIVFLSAGEGERAGKEFLGALAVPFLALGCLFGALASAVVSVFEKNSWHTTMRRTYAYFEAWVNQIDLEARDLPSYSHRVSGAFEWMGSAENNHIWTTAPCLQPVLERGFARRGGLLDAARMQKLFPFIRVNDVEWEDHHIVIQSEYEDEHVHYEMCNGACEHSKTSSDCCCCYRVEAAYDRVLCCEAGQGTCTSLANSGDSCGISSCAVCGVGACCCYTKEDHELTSLNAGCFGPQGVCCATTLERRIIA